MEMSHMDALSRAPVNTRCLFGQGFVPPPALLADMMFAVLPAVAQQRASDEVTVKQVASEVYFLFDFNGSNAVFLVTEEGVLVIDTRTHPRAGRDLLDRIRKLTDKPIKWVINSHFHGDHHMGNSGFKAAGATLVAQKETARLMQQTQPTEMARRVPGFKRRGYDPDDGRLMVPARTL